MVGLVGMDFQYGFEIGGVVGQQCFGYVVMLGQIGFVLFVKGGGQQCVQCCQLCFGQMIGVVYQIVVVVQEKCCMIGGVGMFIGVVIVVCMGLYYGCYGILKLVGQCIFVVVYGYQCCFVFQYEVIVVQFGDIVFGWVEYEIVVFGVDFDQFGELQCVQCILYWRVVDFECFVQVFF